MRKTESAVQRCKTMSTLQKILGGKWKLEILYYIAFHDILLRHDFKEIPPRVEYTLSDLGRSFIDVISYMKTWGDNHLPTE